jgi:signal transduction histidine kinase
MARHVKLNRFIRSKNEALRQENLQRSAGIEQMSKRAAKVEEMKSNFAALAVHELHTPLSSLSSCVYMLQNFPDMSEDERRMIYEVLSSTTARLETLIGDVLNVIEEEQERPLRKIPMSLNEVVREVEKEVGPFIKKRNQTLVLCLAEELPPHEGDAGRIWQAVMNLVMNAIRFTPDGGIIVVATRAADDGAHLLVADTGIGIPKEDYENIFEMFYEGIDVMHHCSGTIEFMSGSLGLGLPTAKSIVERHGGRISLSSAVGVGSTFTIELPALAKSSVNEPCAAREATSPESQ